MFRTVGLHSISIRVFSLLSRRLSSHWFPNVLTVPHQQVTVVSNERLRFPSVLCPTDTVYTAFHIKVPLPRWSLVPHLVHFLLPFPSIPQDPQRLPLYLVLTLLIHNAFRCPHLCSCFRRCGSRPGPGCEYDHSLPVMSSLTSTVLRRFMSATTVPAADCSSAPSLLTRRPTRPSPSSSTLRAPTTRLLSRPLLSPVNLSPTASTPATPLVQRALLLPLGT